MADSIAMRVQAPLILAAGATMCALGRHDHKPYRSLTGRSREFRCIRCEKQWVDAREEWIPWPFQGAHPYGQGDDSLGEKIAWRGATLKEDRVDQTPYARWASLRNDYLVSIGRLQAASTG